jgi:ketosteroid isomerase-like protein
MNEGFAKTSVQQPKKIIERVYHEWDKALSSNDMDALLELYAQDAVIESPLIPHLQKKKNMVFVKGIMKYANY